MRIYLCGQKYFGATVLHALLDVGHTIVGVSAPFADAKGRPDRLMNAATIAGLPVMRAGRLNADTLPAGVDLIVAAHSHDFIGEKTRLRARYGAIGYHPSLLPVHRGRDAVRWAVRLRERITGGSIYWLSNTVDGGPIAAQRPVFIRPDDTAEELWRRDLAPLGVNLILQVTNDIACGRIVKVEQDEALATWEPALGVAPLHRPDLIMLGYGTSTEPAYQKAF